MDANDITTMQIVLARPRHRLYGVLKWQPNIWHEIPFLGRPDHRGPEIPYMTRCGHLARPFQLDAQLEAPVLGRRPSVTCLLCLAEPDWRPCNMAIIDESEFE